MNKVHFKKALLVAVAGTLLSSSFVIGSRANATVTLYGTGCTLIGGGMSNTAVVTNGNCRMLQAIIVAYATATATLNTWYYGLPASTGSNTIPKSVATAPTTRVYTRVGSGWYLDKSWSLFY